MIDPNAAHWRIRREFDNLSEKIDRQILRSRRGRAKLSFSRLQAVESLRHKRDTLQIRFWLLDRHGEAPWHCLHAEIEEAWRVLKAQWNCNAMLESSRSSQ